MMSLPEKTKDLTGGAVFLAAAAFFILCALGFWQVQRLEWKANLLQKIEARMEAPAVTLPADIPDPEEWEYRRVTVSGRVLAGREFLLKPRVRNGKAGYHRIVPLQTDRGHFVFANLGWSDEVPPAPLASYLSLDGLVIIPVRARFTPENNPEKNEWYWADIPAMARAAGLTVEQARPLLVVAGQEAAPEIANNHLHYAIFWFTMAFAVIAIFFIRFFRPGKSA